MTVRIDANLPLSSPTAPPGPVGDADSPLALAGQARPEPYLLEGERTVVRGVERGGVAAVDVDGRRIVEALRSDAGLGVNVVVSPTLIRRECVGSRGTTLQTVLALPTLPLAAFQWSRGEGLEVAFLALPGQKEIRYHAMGSTLRAEPPDPDFGVEVLIHPSPERWTVVEGVDGGIQVQAQVSESGPVTLLVASGSPTMASRALEAGRHLAAHALRSATDQDPDNVDRLLPLTGVPELDQGVGWATLRLAGALRREEMIRPDDWFWAGVGALASGDAPGALLAARRVRDGSSALWDGAAAAPGAALATFLTARATLLSGKEEGASETLASLSPARLEDIRLRADPSAWAWWTLALTALADALRYAASEEDIQGLRSSAARPAGRTPRVLPMVGNRPGIGSARWLRALLRGERPDGGGGHGAADGHHLAAWTMLASGDVEGGYAAWRATLRQGLNGEAGPRGSWSPPGKGAASVVATLAFGLLGLEPDAPSGRIRVAPVLPSHLNHFRVRGIRVGEARLDLSYRREGRVHRFQLDPTVGRVPPMVVLEPSLPFPVSGSVRIDGARAELTQAPEGRRTRLSVQIPVDGPRILEIEEG
ncbi:MAG TPA: hypothetical protein VLA36_15145 [Longimicrobiales bacterium]|nr:hypothetical protein [Longimicrobiales bacterium]